MALIGFLTNVAGVYRPEKVSVLTEFICTKTILATLGPLSIWKEKNITNSKALPFVSLPRKPRGCNVYLEISHGPK